MLCSNAANSFVCDNVDRLPPLILGRSDIHVRKHICAIHRVFWLPPCSLADLVTDSVCVCPPPPRPSIFFQSESQGKNKVARERWRLVGQCMHTCRHQTRSLTHASKDNNNGVPPPSQGRVARGRRGFGGLGVAWVADRDTGRAIAIGAPLACLLRKSLP
jgi:hypothetical protein